jgi:anti-sigma B factor antagonist
VPATFTHHATQRTVRFGAVSGGYQLKEELLDRAVGRRIRVLAVSGELDMAAARAFEATLLEAVSADEPVILDLTEVTFLDSTAIGAMVAVRRRAELMRGRLALVCKPDSEIERTLLYTGLDTAFEIVQSRTAAAVELAAA